MCVICSRSKLALITEIENPHPFGKSNREQPATVFSAKTRSALWILNETIAIKFIGGQFFGSPDSHSTLGTYVLNQSYLVPAY